MSDTVDLGTKHECPSCSTKYYDLGKSEILCPKCGAAPDEEGGEQAKTAKKAAKKKATKKAPKKAAKKKTAVEEE